VLHAGFKKCPWRPFLHPFAYLASSPWVIFQWTEWQVVEGVWKTKSGEDLRVREVWQDNLEEEMGIIRNIVDDYPFLAMDTELPGVVARPVGPFKNSGEYHYQTLRCALLCLGPSWDNLLLPLLLYEAEIIVLVLQM